MLDYLIVGTIINVHGVVGEVKISPTTDDITRFKKMKTAFLCPPENSLSGGERKEIKIEQIKFLQNRFVIMKIEGINDRDTANKLRGYEIAVDRAHAVKLPEDSYFIGDLVGCTVYEEDGNVLGVIDDVFPAGGADVYSVCDSNGKSIMIPAIGDVVMNVDIIAKAVTVRLLPGLKEIYFNTQED